MRRRRTGRRGSRRAAPRPRAGWGASRGRLIYLGILYASAAIVGIVLAVAPGVFGASPGARVWGGVLAGYALVRGYYFYRRLRMRGSS